MRYTSRMVVPVVVLVAAAALWWLSVMDRASVLAISLVELEGKVGVPLWIPFGLLGSILLVARLIHARRPPPRRVERPLTRDAPKPAQTEALPMDGGWLGTVKASARQVSDDAMGKVRFDEAAGVPVSLVLTSVTKEQARRRVAAYAAWLGTIPTPPVARVRVVSSPELEGPLAAMFRGEIARHFPSDSFHVTSAHGGADVLFHAPDARWR